MHPDAVGTLCASGAGLNRPAGQANELDFVVIVEGPKGVRARRLTPTEAERCQGFPDGWTDVADAKGRTAPDLTRYKMIGNSMAVPVLRWIGERLQSNFPHERDSRMAA